MEITIEITQFCEHDCFYCSSKASPQGKHLDIKYIETWLRELKEDPDIINISGGEPLSHPNFYQILNLCKKYTKDVRVYTNALSYIIYNTDIVQKIKLEANVCLTPGNRYIPSNADNVRLLKLVPKGRGKDIKPVNITFSGKDCKDCNHSVLQADGKTVKAPCKKSYD